MTLFVLPWVRSSSRVIYIDLSLLYLVKIMLIQIGVGKLL